MTEQQHQHVGTRLPAEVRDLLARPGIEGIGHDGTHAIVYVRDASVEAPAEVDGRPVRVVVTGEIVAL